MEGRIFVTLEQAAEILQTNKRHIKRMAELGVIRGKDISLGTHQRRRWRVLHEDIVKLKNETPKKKSVNKK